MIVHSALNGLVEYDGVSEFCLLFQDRCRDLGIENRIYAETVSPSLRNRARPLDELAFANNPDDLLIWHFFNESPGVHLAERFPGRRALFYHNITPHAFFTEGSSVWRECFLGREQLPSLTHSFEWAVGQSEFTRRELEELGFLQTGIFPLFSKFNAVCTKSLRDRNESEPWILATTCRVVPHKNLEESIEIVAALQEFHPAQLHVVGSTRQTPDYAQQLLQLARSRGVFLEFRGSLSEDELRAAMRSADGYLCTSRHEGFCLPLLEAMALECPVFAVPRTAIADTLGGSGVALPLDSPGEAAKEIANVLQSEDRRRDVLSRQRKRLEDFTPEEDRRRVRELLDKVATRPRLPRTAESASVSVVVSTWNRADHLESCLRQLQRQCHPRFEVIVVNGPSTDHTEDVLSRFDSLVKVRRTRQANLCVSRNLGLAAAAGEFIAFLDDDAIAHPDWLRELLAAFDDPLTAAAGGQTYRHADEGLEFANGVLTDTAYPVPVQARPGTWHSAALRQWNTVTGNNCMFRREALLGIGGFDERLEYSHDEADVVLRLAARGRRTRHRPLAIVHHGSQPSENRRSEFDINWPAILKNSIYCGVKNRPADRPVPGYFLRTIADHARRRFRDPWDWWKYGRISFSLFLRIERRCAWGIVQGIAKAIFARPRLRAEWGAARGDFLRYETSSTVRNESVVHVTCHVPFRKQNGEGNRSTWLAQALAEHGFEPQILAQAELPWTDSRGGIRYHFVPNSVPARQRHLAALGKESSRMFSRAYAVWTKMCELAVRCGTRVAIAPLWESEGLLVAQDPRFQTIPIVITPVYETMRIERQSVTEDMQRALDFERSVLQGASAIVGISQTTTREVLTHYGLEGRLCEVIPIGIPDNTTEEGNLHPPAPTRLVYIGPLNLRKGAHQLLEAVGNILRKHTEAHADFVGEFPDEPMSPMGRVLLEWKQASADILPRVQFHGPVSERRKQELLEQCTLLLMPSLYESFGIPAVEAMRHGKPVVASAVGGLNDVVADGENGLLVPPRDVESFSIAVSRLLSEPTTWERMARNARSRYERHYTLAAMGERFATLLHKLCDERECEQPLLAAAQGEELQGSACVSRWRDPYYLREFARLLPGAADAMVWLDGPPLEAGWRVRADVYLGINGTVDADEALAALSLRNGDRILVTRIVRGREFGERRWGILSLDAEVLAAAETSRVELQASGAAELRVQRVELRRRGAAATKR